ncbi:MAG: tRNA uridine-5-carboxymethylaminomethyl(34) synthesis GTPase MnmE [Eubacteriales bacterium]|nr:tRNA uridine-5-carboxymethylaminomethyl(34) synthesis GTPase MnmE [Eubacteriales bacterium]
MEETIAAIATAFGEGGIGIVRISGEKSKEILETIFKPIGMTKETSIANRRLAYGHIVNPKEGSVIDEVLAVFMPGPASYTCEDVVEIQCHGSVIALGKIFSLVLAQGARIAEPGEFTKRAFLNGRIDLSQAEGVIDLIRAKTDKAFETALDQMEGGISALVRECRAALTDLLVQIAVNIDYPEEDIEEMTYEKLLLGTEEISERVRKLLSTAETGRMIREGLRVTIVGRPNVGKSSLMNALLRESRAIVTNIPGTTRDTIEEVLSLRGIPVYLTDTAGIHETEDLIEQIGIEKSKEAFQKADLILFMIDGSLPLRVEDKEIALHIGERKTIVLVNKMDLGKQVSTEELKELLPEAMFLDTSLVEGNKTDELEEKILSLVYGGEVKQDESCLVTNARQKDLLLRTEEALQDAIETTKRGEALDFVEMDIRTAWDLLGEMIGETVSESIIDEVFARFCLGK